MSVTDSMPVGVIIERREIDNKWQQYVYAPVGVIAGAPAMKVTDPWKPLHQGDGWIHYHAGTLELELHDKQTTGYRNNLMNERPYVFIVMQQGEEADEPEVMPKLITVCPDEAADYLDTTQAVEGVAMPPEMIAWVQDFVDKHHVEVKFIKRKRQPYDPRKSGFRGRRPQEESNE